MKRRTMLQRLGGLGLLGASAGCVNVSESDSTATSGGGGGQQTTSGSGTNAAADDASTATVTPGNAAIWYKREGSEVDSIEANVQAFNDQTPHTIEGSNIAELESRTTTQLPAGEGPELFGWAHDWVGDYYQRGFLSDQSDAIDVDMEGTFTEAAVDAVQFDGATVGLPFSAETVGLIYNRDMVDEPPETLGEMQSIMEDHHDPDNGQYGLSYPIDPYFVSAWAHAFGGYYYDGQSDELGLTDDATVRGLQLVLDELVPYTPEDPGYDPQASVFVNGNAPLAINGPWFLGNTSDIDTGIASIPAPDGGSPSPYTGISLWYFTARMDDDETRAAAARSFAEWYATSPEIHLDLAETHGFIPVLSELQGSDELPDSVQGYSEAVGQGTPMPSNPNMNQVWGPVGDAITRALNGDQDLQPSLAQAEETIRSNW